MKLSRFARSMAVLLALTGAAAADEYPNRPVRLIIPPTLVRRASA